MNLAPPTYVMQEVRYWKVRGAISAGTFQGSLSNLNLASFMGVIATGATTSVLISDQFKLKRICCWTPCATAGVPVTCQMKYTDDPASNTQSGAPKTVSDTTISFDRPAYACLEPPRDNSSIFSQWWDSSLSTTMVNVIWPVGTIVDLEYRWIMDDIGVTTAGPTLIAATAGVIYHKLFQAGAGTLSAVGALNSI